MPLGYWIDKGVDLWEAQPEALVAGIASWDDIPAIYYAYHPKFISLRDTRKPLLDRQPESVADEICNKILSFPLEIQRVCVAHGLDEEHRDRPRAVNWELRFIERVHSRGLKVIAWNVAFGNFNNYEAQDFRQVWLTADYLGPHMYIGYSFKSNSIIENEETCYRYRQWQGFPRNKCLPTEFGVDYWNDGAPHPYGDEKPGWRRYLDENTVKELVLRVVKQHIADGLLGDIWFAKSTQNAEWESYYPTQNQEIAWQALPKLGVIMDNIDLWLNSQAGVAWLAEAGGRDKLVKKLAGLHAGAVSQIPSTIPMLKEFASLIAEYRLMVDQVSLPDEAATILKKPSYLNALEDIQSALDFLKV